MVFENIINEIINHRDYKKEENKRILKKIDELVKTCERLKFKPCIRIEKRKYVVGRVTVHCPYTIDYNDDYEWKQLTTLSDDYLYKILPKLYYKLQKKIYKYIKKEYKRIGKENGRNEVNFQ